MEFKRCYRCMEALDTPGAVCRKCGYDNTRDPASQPGHALPCGTVLAGRYVVGRVLGQGGFGITYMAWNLALEIPVCIKEYFPAGAALRSTAQSGAVLWSGGESAEELKRGREGFVKEARKAVKLRDLGHVVKVWDVFYENDTAYIVMDYIEGETLKSWLLRRGSPVDEKTCFSMLEPVMRDLEQVHDRGIIHRDIKPDNLMLTPEGKLMLLDLGAAKDLSGGSGQSSYMVASQGFSPMEQYRKNGSIGPWTDVYAMCATIYYCVTGRLLPTPMDRFSGEATDFSRVSAPVAAVLEKGLALKPEERIRDMAALLSAFQAAIVPKAPTEKAPAPKKEPVPVKEPVPAEKPAPVSKAKGKKKLVPLLVSVLLLAACAVILPRYTLGQRQDNAAATAVPTAASTLAEVRSTAEPYSALSAVKPQPASYNSAKKLTLLNCDNTPGTVDIRKLWTPNLYTLNEPLENFTDLSMWYSLNSYEGQGLFGTWELYGYSEDGGWRVLRIFELTEEMKSGETFRYDFHFTNPQTVTRLALAEQSNSDASCNMSVAFFTETPAAANIKDTSRPLLNDEDAKDGLSFEVYGDHAVITGSDGRSEVRIPAQINCRPVTEIADKAFYMDKELTDAVIPGTVSDIGSNAFAYCKRLSGLTIQKGVTNIQAGVFMYCTGLKELTIPEGVTQLGGSAFMGCTALTDVWLPESLTALGNSVFAGCLNLKIHAKAGSYAANFLTYLEPDTRLVIEP